MIINHNLSAMRALHYLGIDQQHMQNAMLRLSTGKRINSAADDAAGLTISEHMKAQITSLNVAVRNSQDTICALQTAEGGLSESQSILQRMNELAVQAANGTNSTADRDAIKSEFSQLGDELSHISKSTNFNGINLLGSYGNLTFQIGATSNSYDSFSLNLSSFNTSSSLSSIEDGSALNLDTPDNARSCISVLQTAIDSISSSRSIIGASENALQYNIENLNSEAENLTAAESNITDADMAKEILKYAKYNVLQQVGQSILSQSLHQDKDNILKLLDSLHT